MPDANSWNVISDADSDQVILGFDFSSSGRPEAGISDLATVGEGWDRYRFLQCVPPDIGVGGRPSADAYTGQWIEDLQNARWQVAAVLGFCVGGVFAARIADAVSAYQAPPRLILFDPHIPDCGLFRNEGYKVFNQIKPLLSDDTFGHVKERIDGLTESAPADMADIGIALVELYREIGSSAFARLGLAQARQDELIKFVDLYMSWISAATRIDPVPLWKRAPAIVSADYVAGLEYDSSSKAACAAVARTIPVEVNHKDLLRSESAARLMFEQIGAGQP